MFADAIAQARALRPFASFAGEPLDLPTLTRRLEVLTGLSHSTAERRAHTLIKWRRYVQGPTPENNGGLELAAPPRRSRLWSPATTRSSSSRPCNG